jgi:hypothetical protein
MADRVVLVEAVEARLAELVAEMRKLEHSALPPDLPDSHASGARNLLHYVALRRHDIRGLQSGQPH